MPCYIRMKTVYLRGLLWLYLLGFGYMVLSLEPGYLDFDNLPDTNFSCAGKVVGGYYADVETNCQMFHVCTIGQLEEMMDIRFLCLNGTVFDQETRVCERIDEVDCSKSEKFYSLNLELYGNTQPTIVEDNAETEPPIIKSTTTTTTTTTTTQRPKPKTTRAPYYTTATPTVTTASKVISTHHFPISNQPDIRFNPEEINISLNPGAPPSIRTRLLPFQQQIYSSGDDISAHNNNKKAILTAHNDNEDFARVVPHTQRPQVSSSTQKSSYGLTRDKNQPPATPADINYGFTYHQSEDSDEEYQTEPPRHNYQYHHDYRHGQFRNQFKTTTYRTEHVSSTRKHPFDPPKEPTTYRTSYVVSSLRPTSYHSTYRTERPQRLQLPLPSLPTLPPLTFSSPAPFSLTRHVDSKRYTNEHQPPPRIIISASASVSDASGRRLNYSLGTIGVTPVLEETPKSYNEYKDHDVVLDPFYHDVPKLQKKRSKRQIKHSDIIRNEQEAVDVLKFLFDWYKDQETTTITVPISPEVITEINEQLAPVAEMAGENQNATEEAEVDEDSSYNFRESGLFRRKSKFNIVGDVLSVTEKEEVTTTTSTTPTPISNLKADTEDYVDDNYEAVVNQDNVTEAEVKTVDINTERPENVEEISNTENYQENKQIEEETNEEATVRDVASYIETTEKEDAINTTVNSLEESNLEDAKNREIHQESVMDKGEDFSEPPTISEDVDDEDNEHMMTTTTTTTTTTPKPKSRRRNRGRYHQHGRENNKKYSASFVDDPDRVHRPSRRRGRVRSTTESHILESVSEELARTTTGRTKEIEEITTTEVATSLTSTLKELELTTTLQSKEYVEDAAEKINVTEVFQNETTTSKETPHVVETSDYEKEVEEGRPRLRGRGRNRVNIYRHETESKPVILTATTEEIKTSELPKIENEESEVAIEGQSVDETVLPEPTTDSTVAPEVTSTTTDAISTVLEPNMDSDVASTFHHYEEKTTESLYDDRDVEDEQEKTLEVDETTKLLPEVGASENTLNEDKEETMSPPDEEEHFLATTDESITSSSNVDSTSSTISRKETKLSIKKEKSEKTTFEYHVESKLFDSSEDESTTNADITNSEIYQIVTTASTVGSTNDETNTTTESAATNITPAEITTAETPRRSHARRTRPPRYRSSLSYRKPNTRHRFSSESLTLRPSRRKPVIEEEIIDALTRQLTSTESVFRVEDYTTSSIATTTTTDFAEEVPATDAPLFKSANPTQAESAKESLHTTPLSKAYKLHVRKEKVNKSFIFNCFGKAINKFYSDPRDCRLFHYCTPGYTKNQLLDMKFVCDLGTYFDDEKLICTKAKPERCL